MEGDVQASVVVCSLWGSTVSLCTLPSSGQSLILAADN